MSKGKGRIVTHRPDGTWGNQNVTATKPANVHPTQKEAIQAAKQNLQNQGGGELTIQGKDGKIVGKNTIAPGNDPCPPRDKK